MTDLDGGAFCKLLIAVSVGSLHVLEHHHDSMEALQKRIQNPGTKPLKLVYALD